MNLRFRRFTTFLSALLSALLVIVFAHMVLANDTNPEPENRVGQISEAVVEERLQQLGYAKPTVMELQNNVLQGVQIDRRFVPATHYKINTIKDGRSVLLRVDRLSGKIEEIPLNNR